MHQQLGEEIHQVFLKGHILYTDGTYVLLLSCVLVFHIYVLDTLIGGFVLSQLNGSLVVLMQECRMLLENL